VRTGAKQSDLVAALRAEGIVNSRLLEAVRAVPRANFVPPDLVHRAYLDERLPIPRHQVTTQPSLVVKMLDALELDGRERVLEVGPGYGWQTGLLAQLAREVWSVERWPDLAETAREHLRRERVANATVVVADGSEGLAEQAPFDAIVVAAASPEVPAPLAEQLAVGGRLVHPIGPGGFEEVVLFERRTDGLSPVRRITGAHFVRLIGRRALRA
jgi:protein-L-isoaspartate(D-aspartate) O-methyltransferase